MAEKQKPTIDHINTVAKSNLFTVEQINLTFSNGEQRVYERLKPSKHNAVMIVPVINNEIILIREYAVGIEAYELGFPKGAVEPEEDLFHAANRELMEEIGYGAKRMSVLSQVTTSPSYFSHLMTIIIAEELYPQKYLGDEPEPLIQVHWPISEMMSLLNQPDFRESRNICALFMAHDYLNNNL